MPRRKILFLISSLNVGGAERQTIDLVNRLDASRYAISLCYLLQGANLKSELRIEKLDELHCLNKKWRLDFMVLWRLKNIMDTIRPEVVVCVNSYTAFYAHVLRICFRKAVKIITIMHSTIMLDRYNDLIVDLLYGPLANRSDMIVFVCQNQMNYWIRKYRINADLCRYIYNGVDTARFTDLLSQEQKSEIRARHNIREWDFVICICAVLRPEKRHSDLIDACKILLDKGFSVKLLVVGDGAERGAVDSYVQRVDIKEHVVMTGFQQDVRPFIAVSDVFVIASSSEAFSMAILEAMALGKAIVSSDIGGASEQVVEGLNGFLFPPGDVHALASCLERIIITKSENVMGKQSREMVRRQFTVEHMMEQYSALFNSI